MAEVDKHTLSNYTEAEIKSAVFDWSIDFAASVLTGTVHYTFEVHSDTDKVVLDTSHLNVTAAREGGEDAAESDSLTFSVGDEVKPFGCALTVELGSTWHAGESRTLSVTYSTTTESTALQWLTKEQTQDKQQPFLFTQCQAIHARSLYPCQDTPAVKFTYKATVKTVDAVKVLMAAIPDGDAEPTAEGSVFSFTQDVKVPSYLVSLAAGHFECRQLSERCFVWAEPSIVASAAYEFEDTEEYVRAGEALLGPYAWKQVHLLVMPPSFPYGGMEGNLINITPTLLAGDKSLADVIAHEVAHSWTGNLVTSATWEHFWLNEGWTMMVQRKMVQAVIRQQQGDDAAEAFWDFDSYLGQEALRQDVCQYGEHHPFTCLVPHLEGVDPDDSFSSVPYEKGYHLLQFLQNKVGGPKYWEPFMGHYIGRFANTSLTTKDFQACLLEFFAEEGALGEGCTLGDMDWEQWLHTPGMPQHDNGYDMTQVNECAAVADAWVAASPDAPDAPVDISAWSSSRRVAVLDHLLRRITALGEEEPPKRLAADSLQAMDAAYGFGSSQNCEIKFRWLRCTVASGCADWDACASFLRVYGRMKYVRPLFRDLLQDAEHREAAVALAAEKAGEYHPICAKMVKEDVKTLTGQAAVDKSGFVVLGTSAEDEAAATKAEEEAAAAAAAKLAEEEAAAAKLAEEEAAVAAAATQKAEEEAAAAKLAEEEAAAAAAAQKAEEEAAAAADAEEEAAAAADAEEEAAAAKLAEEEAAARKAEEAAAAAADAEEEAAAAVDAASAAATAESATTPGEPVADTTAADLDAALQDTIKEHDAGSASHAPQASTGDASVAVVAGDADGESKEVVNEDGAAVPTPVAESGSVRSTTEADDVPEGVSPRDEDETSSRGEGSVHEDEDEDEEEDIDIDEEEEEEEEVEEVVTASAASTLKAESDALARSAEAAAAAKARAAKTAELLQHADEAAAADAAASSGGSGGLVGQVTGSVQQQVDKVLDVEVTESAGTWLSTGLAVAGVAVVGAAVVYGVRRWSNRSSSS